MATVSIGRPYFDALLRRAEFHTSGQDFDTTPSLSNNVTISKAEHDYLLHAVREYNLLKSALFKGGLTTDTLNTLLSAESGVTNDGPAVYDDTFGTAFVRPRSVPITMTAPRQDNYQRETDNTSTGYGLVQPRTHSHSYNRVPSFGQPDSSIETPEKDEDLSTSLNQRVAVHDRRTILITNVSDRTTHKDLVEVIRGGRVLDIFLRGDRSATVSFVEGAQEFLAYAKRNDIYMHMKRLEFRWSDRQFHVPPHVANKIANGATRNIVVRGAVGKLTAEQIRDHLDHIHNLVVVDINFRNGDAFISLNSIHNGLFAKTCMMSRTAYKSLRIDWYADECAAPLPRPVVRSQLPSMPMKPAPITNPYAVLDTGGSDTESEDDDHSYLTNGISLNNWADTIVA